MAISMPASATTAPPSNTRLTLSSAISGTAVAAIAPPAARSQQSFADGSQQRNQIAVALLEDILGVSPRRSGEAASVDRHVDRLEHSVRSLMHAPDDGAAPALRLLDRDQPVAALAGAHANDLDRVAGNLAAMRSAVARRMPGETTAIAGALAVIHAVPGFPRNRRRHRIDVEGPLDQRSAGSADRLAVAGFDRADRRIDPLDEGSGGAVGLR